MLASVLSRPALLPRTIRPRWASLELTDNCNARCVMCDHWRDVQPETISTERAIGLLRELRDLGVGSVRLTGGEALLRDDLFEILGTCEPSWFRSITLATNGLLLERHAERINDSVITNVTVSLDGIGSLNDAIRGTPDGCRKTMEALRGIRKPVKIVSVLTRDLLPDLEELLELCRENGYGYDINIPDAQPFLHSSPEAIEAIGRLRPSPEETEQALELLTRYEVLPGYLAGNVRSFQRDRTFDFEHCVLGYLTLTVDPFGGVTPGCIPSPPVGSVLESDLPDIVRSGAYVSQARRMFALDCPLCACGYNVSAACHRPWRATAYVWDRLRKASRKSGGRS